MSETTAHATSAQKTTMPRLITIQAHWFHPSCVHHIIGATDLSALRGYDLQCPRISHGTHQGRIRSRVRPATERCARRKSCRTSGSPLLFEQSTLDRVADHLGTGGRPELGHDVGTVALDRPDADVELLGDLLVGMTKGEQTQYLTLAR